ncbi:MAG: VWA-like domain-containing protein [Kofleriaceae bacterium]
MKQGWFEAFLAETGVLEEFPGYAGVLARMDVVASERVPVAAVTLRRMGDPHSRLQLMINREYFTKHPEDRLGVLLHEIQHVLLGHLSNPMLHRVAKPRIMEIAMEISADEAIAEYVPDHGFAIDDWAFAGIAPGQSTIERYRILAEAHACKMFSLDDGIGERMLDTHRPGKGGLGDLLDAGSDGATERNWNQRHAYLGPPTAQAELERMKLVIAAHLRGDRGGDDDFTDPDRPRVPKQLARIIFHGGTSTLDWRRVLREAFPRRRQIRHDYLRPNRRFPQRVGEIPGRTRRPPKPLLLVGIDTSGSMTGEMLDRIALETARLARYAKLTIVECDAAVHRVYPLGAQLGPFTGGGDTDFAPVFDEAHASRFEGIVYFSDGRAALPPRPQLPVLWAITRDDPFEAEYGAIVRITSS